MLQGLWEQLLRTLNNTIDALGISGLEWEDLIIAVAGQIIVSLIILTVLLAVYLVLKFIIGALIKTRNPGATLFTSVQVSLRYTFILAAVIALAAQYGASGELLTSMVRAGVMGLGFYLVWIALTNGFSALLRRHTIDASLGQLINNMLSVVLLTLGIITLLAQFGFDVLSIVAGLGIVGIAVGFAAQSTLSNFIAGITLLVERPFRIGDWVRINDQEGKVVKIAFRTTWLRTRDNIFTMIPNDSVATSDIVNFSAKGPTRVRIPLGIAYKESAKKARGVILPLLQAHEKALQVPGMEPRVVMTGLGDSSVDLVALYWIQPEDIDIQSRITAELLEQIKEALDEAGIEIPFPHLQLFIDEAKGLAPLLTPLKVHSSESAAANAQAGGTPPG